MGCEECGFEYDLTTAPGTASSIVTGVAEFAAFSRAFSVKVRL